MSSIRFSSTDRFQKTFGANIYPKPLSRLNLHTSVEEDENGLTVIERNALVRAWRLVEPFKRRLGREVFHDFLVRYENLFEHFRRDGKLDLELLHRHAQKMMNLVSKLIKEVEFPLEMHSMLMQAMPPHSRRKVSEKFILLLAENLCEYIYNSFIFEESKTPTLYRAFEKLFLTIGTFLECERDRKHQLTMRYSTMRHSLVSLLSKKSTFSIYSNKRSLQGKQKANTISKH